MDKKCIKCNETKDITEFYTKYTGKDGHCNECKEYTKKDRKQRGKSESTKKKHKEWRKNNKEYLNEYARERYHKNPEPKKQYLKKNRQKLNTYQRNKRATDPQYKIAMNLRRRTNQLLAGKVKPGSPIKKLGCTLEFLIKYLEQMFYPNPDTREAMTWENHNLHGWHLDHIKQLASFDLTDPEQFAQACHYTNLQPLWAKANLHKNKPKSAFSGPLI